MIAEARALLGALLEHRLALLEHRLALALAAAGRTGERDLAAIAAVRTDRNEAIAVHAALLYWLPADDPAWPDVAMTVGRLSYDRYSHAWRDPEAPAPDDLDAACDLLLRAAPSAEADERTARYLVLALRDRQRLLACPADTSALMTWGQRLLAFPDAGGLGRASLQDLLELELRNRTESLARAGSRGPWGLQPLSLTGKPVLTARPVLTGARGAGGGHADRTGIREHARARQRERGEHLYDVRGDPWAQACPGPRRGMVRGVLDGGMRVPAGARQFTVRAAPAAAGQPAER